ncbi:alpha/beta hydrolase family protein [Pseudoalteromonas luteoviolacea]|uniref:alpha/beta hydrolase family protein n=1 Tax=Pseudoalteromonas luteoviolacea TaxID=43657 RepID=UPI001B37BC77|nr:prolyl oligopeptidase family serine peptidase [Pseudoalteromonas luteoviolacea]MBQ4836844.1 prolyl oligopeptidase family serine peptidase [Pseudoalteromonas luteoviolacea]
MKFLLFLSISLFFVNTVKAQCNSALNDVNVQGVCTKIKTYKSDEITKTPVLVVALHGDSPFNNPSYQYEFANQIALHSINTVSVGMLRPGYTDHLKRTSDGVRGETVGDNYDESRIHQIAKAIQKLKVYHNSDKVILAGHSGGSAITAKLIALYPRLINHAFIVSCPCNIPQWRADMYKSSHYEGFKKSLATISPIELIDNVANEIGITLFVGKDDKVTKPYLSNEYFAALKKAGKKVDYHVIDGDHRLFLNQTILNSVVDVVSDYNKPSQPDS